MQPRMASTLLRRLRMAACLPIIVLAAVLSGGCAGEPPPFDAERAFEDLEKQVSFGPRIPGSEGHRQCADWLRQQLSGSADTVWTQPFIGSLPGLVDSVPMENIIARFGKGKSRRVLLGAHWDTRPHADLDPDTARRTEPCPGANDGASGVAVLLEIARGLAVSAPSVGVDIVLFDGEDAGLYGDDGTWCQGSEYFASRMPAKYRWAIIVDMVGDRQQELFREGHSLHYARELQDRIWATAAAMAETTFMDEREHDIIDDHYPLLMRGVKAVDIIDIRYPSWHSTADTPDKCSPASLGSVGRVVLRVLFDE